MSDIEIKHEGVAAIIEAARASREATVIDVLVSETPEIEGVGAIPMLMQPTPGGGVAVSSVLAEVKAWRDTFATRPIRREGTATLEELASFVEHANRFKDSDSAIFVTGGAASPKFTSILDYHQRVNGQSDEGSAPDLEALPRFGEHRGSYSPKFSAEWVAWSNADRKGLTQEQFAALIQTNVRDVLDVDRLPAGRLAEAPAWFAARFGGSRIAGEFYANAQRLLDLSEGLTVTVSDRVGDVARRDTGETRITFESDRSTSIEIPVAFLIEVPVFVGGDPWQIPVRLRFTVRTEGDTKRAQWRIEMFGAERTVLAVVAEMRETVAKDTALPIFAGAPE